jgi:hypothetical protein
MSFKPGAASTGAPYFAVRCAGELIAAVQSRTRRYFRKQKQLGSATMDDRA